MRSAIESMKGLAIRLLSMLAVLALLGVLFLQASYAYADDEASSAASAEPSAATKDASAESSSPGGSASEQGADEGEDACLAAIASCIDGLFEAWGVHDSADFYASDKLDAANGTSEWLAFDVHRAGLTEGADAFVDKMRSYVAESYAGEMHGLDDRAPTTWARNIIIANALGQDPTAFGNDAAGKSADLLSDGIFNWSYTDSLGDQGSNAWIYALQAVNAAQAKAPKDAKYTESEMLAHLLACQAKDGSFGLVEKSKTGSVDLTGMALSALAPYRDDPGVMQAIEAAVAYLSEQQGADGAFASEGEPSSESCSVAIMGLSACGIDVGNDERFVKGGSSLLDALLSFQRADGTFTHLKGGSTDGSPEELPTDQALRALLAYEELTHGGDGNVYTADYSISVKALDADDAASDVGGLSPEWGMRLYSLGIGIAAGLVFVAALWAIGRIRKKARAEKS